MPAVQLLTRTAVDGKSPVAGSLQPGQLAIEMGTPTRLWVGVPVAQDANMQKLLLDSSTALTAPPNDGTTYGLKDGAWNGVLPLTGGTTTGSVIISQGTTNSLTIDAGIQGRWGLYINVNGGLGIGETAKDGSFVSPSNDLATISRAWTEFETDTFEISGSSGGDIFRIQPDITGKTVITAPNPLVVSAYDGAKIGGTSSSTTGIVPGDIVLAPNTNSADATKSSIVLSDLPTVAPTNPEAVWNNGGVLNIGAGAVGGGGAFLPLDGSLPMTGPLTVTPADVAGAATGLTLNGGVSTGDSGGGIAIAAGKGGINGGAVTIKGGDSANFNAGGITITPGASSGFMGKAGDVLISGGLHANSAAPAPKITLAGATATFMKGGPVELIGADNTANGHPGGDIIIRQGKGSVPGVIALEGLPTVAQTGEALWNNAGAINIGAGAAGGGGMDEPVGAGAFGRTETGTWVATLPLTSGELSADLRIKPMGTGARYGAFGVYSDPVPGGFGMQQNLYAGDGMTGGMLTGKGGAGTGGNGGALNMSGGATDTFVGGDANINGGDATAGQGGYARLNGGDGKSAGGGIQLLGGKASMDNGAPGSVSITAGPATGAAGKGGFADIRGGIGPTQGGYANLTGGESPALGGNVTLGGGRTTTPTGTPGDVIMMMAVNSDSSKYGNLIFSNLTTTAPTTVSGTPADHIVWNNGGVLNIGKGAAAGGGMTEPVGVGTWARLETGAWERGVATKGDTMTGNLVIIPTGSMPAYLDLHRQNFNAAGLRGYSRTGAGVSTLRWEMFLGNTASESGANSGANFTLSRYTDAGALIDVPFEIERIDPGKMTLRSNEVHLTPTNGFPRILLNAGTGSKSAVISGTVGGLGRWTMELGNNLAEGGSDTGSEFRLICSNDAGTAFINEPVIAISRAVRTVGFFLPPTVKGVPLGAGEVAFPFSFSGKPAAGAVINVGIAFSVRVPFNPTDIVVYASTPATADTVFTLNRISAGVLTQMGTVTVTAGSNTAFTPSVPIGMTVAAGDCLQMVAGVQDATLADVCVTVMALRA